jgi:phospholipid/cholesterol/gamma-HCH transport system substrate-binding protein
MPSARQVNWAKFRVAAVSVAALAILGVLLYLLTGGSIFQQRTTLYVYIGDATGLASGAPVRVDGVAVGKVGSVDLSGSTDPNRVIKVTIKAESGRLARIPADSFAEISPDTLVGDMFVDVTSGRSAKTIPPGGEIAFKPQPELIKSADLAEFDQELKTIEAVLADIEQGQSRVGQFVMGEAVYADLIKRVTEAERGFRAATDVTTGIGKAIHTDELYRRIADPLVELDQSLARLQAARTGPGVYLRDPALYDQMRKAAADLRSSIAGLRGSGFVQSEAMYSAWNGRVQGLIQSVDDANAGPLLLTSQWYEQLEGAAREMRDNLKDFRENPRKYLRMKVF